MISYPGFSGLFAQGGVIADYAALATKAFRITKRFYLLF
ncbi:hypothetical protein M798_02255 [Brucella melitensis ADMAS-G1]|nr:hypothetical protein M798_02255 [Brucella melitensis ADMAS-G1]